MIFLSQGPIPALYSTLPYPPPLLDLQLLGLRDDATLTSTPYMWHPSYEINNCRVSVKIYSLSVEYIH